VNIVTAGVTADLASSEIVMAMRIARCALPATFGVLDRSSLIRNRNGW
jgi:hypothetical protein